MTKARGRSGEAAGSVDDLGKVRQFQHVEG